MSDRSYHPDETFAPAPIGTRVRVVTALVALIIVGVGMTLALVVPRSSSAPAWVALVAPLLPLPIVTAVWGFAYIRAFRLEGRELVVVRPGFPVRFKLEGLQSIEADRDALAGACKLIGNDGLGAVSGRFRSKKFGTFRAFVSDSKRAVVLRAAAGTFVVSPAQTEIFIDAVRRRAGRI